MVSLRFSSGLIRFGMEALIFACGRLMITLSLDDEDPVPRVLLILCLRPLL